MAGEHYLASRLADRISRDKVIGKLVSMNNIINLLVEAGQSNISDVGIALDDDNYEEALKLLKSLGIEIYEQN